jgi:hypothetical protein
MSYDGSATKRATVEVRNNPLAGDDNSRGKAESGKQKAEMFAEGWPKLAGGKPDFDRMTSAHRQVFDAERLKRKFG